jgi:hypothetical protein
MTDAFLDIFMMAAGDFQVIRRFKHSSLTSGFPGKVKG